MSPTILVIDDDASTRTLLAAHLRRLGCQVAAAADGIEAMEHLYDQVANELPSLILLDLMMPRMNGWVFRIEQQKHPQLRHIPVVIMSGVNEPGPVAGYLGVQETLTKPIALEKLRDVVKRYCSAADQA